MRALLVIFTLALHASTAVNAQCGFPAWDTSCFVVDRCAPAFFQNIGLFEGRCNVLQLEVSPTNCLPNFDFYRTQGESELYNQPLPIGATISYSGSLWIPASWATATVPSEYRRSDLWASFSYLGNPSFFYAVIGFTNEGGIPRYRYWDDANSLWIDSTYPVTFNAWSPTLEIRVTRLTQTQAILEYYIGGVFQQFFFLSADTFQSIFVQGYNFGTSYSAFWSQLTLSDSASPVVVFGCPIPVSSTTMFFTTSLGASPTISATPTPTMKPKKCKFIKVKSEYGKGYRFKYVCFAGYGYGQEPVNYYEDFDDIYQ